MKKTFTSPLKIVFQLLSDVSLLIRQYLSYIAAITAVFMGSILGADAQTTTTNFTTAGAATWECPCGVTSIKIACWGGGGGGGGASTGKQGGGGGGAATGNPVAGGGGSGGAVAANTSYTVVPGTTYYINVGAAGTAGAGSATVAGAGGSSWFNTTNVAPTT